MRSRPGWRSASRLIRWAHSPSSTRLPRLSTGQASFRSRYQSGSTSSTARSPRLMMPLSSTRSLHRRRRAISHQTSRRRWITPNDSSWRTPSTRCTSCHSSKLSAVTRRRSERSTGQWTRTGRSACTRFTSARKSTRSLPIACSKRCGGRRCGSSTMESRRPRRSMTRSASASASAGRRWGRLRRIASPGERAACATSWRSSVQPSSGRGRS